MDTIDRGIAYVVDTVSGGWLLRLPTDRESTANGGRWAKLLIWGEGAYDRVSNVVRAMGFTNVQQWGTTDKVEAHFSEAQEASRVLGEAEDLAYVAEAACTQAAEAIDALIDSSNLREEKEVLVQEVLDRVQLAQREF